MTILQTNCQIWVLTCNYVKADKPLHSLYIHTSNKLLVNLKSQNLSHITCNSIKTYELSTLYTTILHNKLKTRLFHIIDSCFFNKNRKRKYSYIVISQSRNYFVKHHSDSTHKYFEVDIKAILEFLIDNIFVMFGNQVFQQTVGIPMGTSCAPLLTDLFLYLYEAEFVQNLLCEKKKSLAMTFNLTFWYIDNVLSINNSYCHTYVDLIYPSELEIKDTTESSISASYLDILVNRDINGKLTTQLYDKQDDFSFSIVM